MKKTICLTASLILVTAGTAQAAGYRIPEQSVDATAKASANIASATRADTAYYNPGKMNWMEDRWHLQGNLTYLYLTSIEYSDDRNPFFDSDSEPEHNFIPTLFVVSPDYAGARFGLSVTTPYGLKKRWKDPYAKAFAEEFSLLTVDINPTVSYGLGEMFSVAVGARMLYADAKVMSNGFDLGTAFPFARLMEDSIVEWGWNVGLSAKPNDKLDMAITYRSNIDLDFADDSKLNLMGTQLTAYGEVSVPAPAVLSVSLAYDFTEKLNVELVWDRTFWSEYDTLDFNFIPPISGNPFERPAERDWDDSNTFRIGLTYTLNEQYTLMGGFAYDNDPIPTENLEFSTPDSTGYIFTAGMQYAVNEKMDIGIAALYDYKESRSNNANNPLDPTTIVYGEFTNAAAFLITAGINYKF